MIVLATGTHRFSRNPPHRRWGGYERKLARTLPLLRADGSVPRLAPPVVPPHEGRNLIPLGHAPEIRVVDLASSTPCNLPQILAGQRNGAA